MNNISKSKLFAHQILIISLHFLVLSTLYTLTNLVHASDPFMLLNPFTAPTDTCMDGKDNDGNGFVDDNCGTASLKVTNDLSGTITNISSICHEDCEID